MGSPLAVVGLRRIGLVDEPNDRSSHDAATPRGAGLAPALAAVVGIILSSRLHGPARAGLLVVAIGVGVVGLADDIARLPALPRLALQAAVAAAALPWLLSAMSGSLAWHAVFAAGVALWIVSFVNAFNFMDGVNGMAVAQTVVAGVAWYLIGRAEGAPVFASSGLILAAAALGFAPVNAVRAFAFLGDVGSYFLGGALAAVAVLGLRAGIAPEAVLAPLAIYLADTGTTIVRRFRRREQLHTAHRDHTYQWLVRNGWSHLATSALVAALIVICSALGAVSLTGSAPARVLADAALVAVLATYASLPSRLLRGRLVETSSRSAAQPRESRPASVQFDRA